MLFWQQPLAQINDKESLAFFLCSCQLECSSETRSALRPSLLYRGMKQLSPLCASIAYFNGIESAFNLDFKLFQEFKAKILSQRLNTRCKTDWDTISLGRHFGLPTRYLDWSSNPLVAIWFAIHSWENDTPRLSDKSSDGTPVVWVLRTKTDDFISNIKKSSPYPTRRNGKTKIFKTRNDIPRVRNQSSFMMRQVFISHDRLTKEKEPEKLQIEPVNENLTFKDRVCSVVIDHAFVQELNTMLEGMGINYIFLFPEEPTDNDIWRLRMVVEEILAKYTQPT